MTWQQWLITVALMAAILQAGWCVKDHSEERILVNLLIICILSYLFLKAFA